MKYNIPENLKISVLDHNGLEPEDKGKYYILRCPKCNQKQMFLYKNKEMLICNRRNKCGYTISFWDFVKENKGLDDKDLANSILNSININTNQKLTKEDLINQNKIELPEGLTFFSFGNSEGMIYQQALNYVKSRNIKEKIYKEWGYVFNPGSIFNKTIFIPFYENGKLVYFITRDWTQKRFITKENGEKEQIRYIMPKNLNSHNFVYNLDNINEKTDLFIFEGLFDACSLTEQIGTATLTASLGINQIKKIWDKSPRNIILVPDNDKTGKKYLDINYKNLIFYKPPSSKAKIFVYNIIGAKDFNESLKEFIDLNECNLYKSSKKIEWQRKTPL